MTDITIETNKRGQEEICGENSRGQKHVVLADQIFVHAATGHIFLAPTIEQHQGLSRLNPHEVLMVLRWLRERGGPLVPNVFAGEPSPDGD